MLTDDEIVQLRTDERYLRATSDGMKGIATDLIRAGNGDWKPEVATALKVAYALVRARIIRSELATCSRLLIERLLNSELQWNGSPEDVKHICEAEGENHIWMRYDEPRVQALFNRVRTMLMDAEFRAILKDRSSPEVDKNAALAHALQRIETLTIETLQSIGTRGVFDAMTKLRADDYYRLHEHQIQQQFLNSSDTGALGQLPRLIEPREDENGG